MTRYVIGPDVALRLAQLEAVIPATHQLLAPTLIRSQVLSALYASVRHGEVEQKDAERRLDYLRGLRLRLLGDRVMQRVAWKIARQLSLPDTFLAEYLALTRLQADAFICLDPELSRLIGETVPLASIDDLISTPFVARDAGRHNVGK